MKKRIVSLFLVLALCAALLPGAVLADEPSVITLTQADFGKKSTDEGSNPKWNDNGFGGGYYSLSGGSYKLGENITLNDSIEISGTVTLDLNGFTLERTAKDGNVILVQNGCSLTLKDSSEKKTGKLLAAETEDENFDPDGLYNRGSFIMEGGTISAPSGSGVLNEGTFTMNGGAFDACETSILNYSTVTLGITTLDATVENRGNFTYQGVTFLDNVKTGSDLGTDINGGIFRGTVENGFYHVYFRKSKITDGVFYGEVKNNATPYEGSTRYSTIEGGVFYGNVTNMNGGDADAQINGGVFYGKVINNSMKKDAINGGVFFGGFDGYEPESSHTITLHLNDDEATELKGVVVGNKLYPLGEPPITREGYTFAGWYEDAEMTQEVTDFESYSVTDNMEFYAKWTRNIDGGDFVLAGGLLSGLLEGAANVLDETFVDVSRGAYYYNAVEWAHSKGIAGGVDKKHFAPDESCTRAQAVTMLWRAAGCPDIWGENPFVDVDADDYYYEAVLWAVANGITSGSDETHFSPDEPCTRGQIVTFLHRAARCYDAHENFGFVDVKTGSYCEDAINWAVSCGITNGTSEATFSPDNVCTRAQIVTFLYRNR